MRLKNLKGLIFDVHRTLVDDSGFPRDRIWRLLKESGVNLDMSKYYALYDDLTKEYFKWSKINPFISIREIHRRRLKDIYQSYGINRDIEKDVNFLWDCMGTSQVYPEVAEVLSAIPGRYKIGLLSNADFDDPLVEKLIKDGYKFDVIVTSFQLKKYKPDPVLFSFVLEKMKLTTDEVVMIGDSAESDIQGARNAGIKIIWINRTNKRLEPHYPDPDFQISDLTELEDIIEF
ncbi:HAD family hydrolase [candidate division KSB1 bacterium]|nr:HAD family hydrolase [candidate division KSB1 bacterium]